MKIKLFEATLPDYSHNDASAVAWAADVCLHKTESTAQDIPTDTWRRVGEAYYGRIVVWHDGCETYVFENCYLDANSDGPTSEPVDSCEAPRYLVATETGLPFGELPRFAYYCNDGEWRFQAYTSPADCVIMPAGMESLIARDTTRRHAIGGQPLTNVRIADAHTPPPCGG